MAPTILLAAGGTGGHLYPAEALAQALAAHDVRVELVSDERVERFAGTFPAAAVHTIIAGTVTGAGALGKLRGMLSLARGFFQCRTLVRRLRPAVVVGFGGYPTVPPVLAATGLRIPTVIHEQNAVMGRANRFLAPRVTAIASGFPLARNFDEAKTTVVGNPVRTSVLAAATLPYPPEEGRLHLLVFGGSQGARVMSDVLPAALEALPPESRARLSIVQQARDEDLPRVRQAYARLGVVADVAPFFEDMPARIAAAQLVVARSGASTVAELSVIGRASILVPLPGALDQDQAANARVLSDAGAATLVPQPEFTPRWLAGALEAALLDPPRLREQAARAKAIGIADAAERFATLVMSFVRQPA